MFENSNCSPLKAAVASTMLGSAEFVAAIQEQYVDVKPSDRNLPALRVLSRNQQIEQIVETVERVVGRENKRLVKRVSLYCCHRYSGRRLQEIASRFGIKESAVSQSSRRFLETMRENEAMSRIVQRLVGELKLSNGQANI